MRLDDRADATPDGAGGRVDGPPHLPAHLRQVPRIIARAQVGAHRRQAVPAPATGHRLSRPASRPSFYSQSASRPAIQPVSPSVRHYQPPPRGIGSVARVHHPMKASSCHPEGVDRRPLHQLALAPSHTHHRRLGRGDRDGREHHVDVLRQSREAAAAAAAAAVVVAPPRACAAQPPPRAGASLLLLSCLIGLGISWSGFM